MQLQSQPLNAAATRQRDRKEVTLLVRWREALVTLLEAGIGNEMIDWYQTAHLNAHPHFDDVWHEA